MERHAVHRGVDDVDVEYRDDPAAEAWTSLVQGSTSTEAMFEPRPGSGYAFRVRAHDAAGLVLSVGRIGDRRAVR
jgi:hypothetical protein